MILYCAVSWKLVKKEGTYMRVSAVASAGTIYFRVSDDVSRESSAWCRGN